MKKTQFPVAIFDLDGTLLEGDSEALWSRFLYEQGIVGADFVSRVDDYYHDYEMGKLNILEYEEYLLRPLTLHPLEKLYQLRDKYLEHIRLIVRPSMMKLVHWHREQGHMLLLITATNSFLAGPIADLLHFPNLICTIAQRQGKQITGKVSGTPVFREGKVHALNQWLAKRGLALEGSWGYSDSHNDLQLLELVEHPVAISPDSILNELAHNREWEVMMLPENRSPSEGATHEAKSPDGRFPVAEESLWLD